MSAQYRMANRLAASHLAEVMAELRAAGQSYVSVSRELYARHGIEVTGETVRAWCDELSIDKGQPSTSGTAA